MKPNPRSRERQRSGNGEPAEEASTAESNAESSSPTARTEEAPEEILPAGAFYEQLVAQFVSESSRSRGSSRTDLDISASNTMGNLVSQSLSSTILSIENIPIDHHVRITDSSSSSGSTNRAGYPEFLRLYENTLLEKTRSLEASCRVVLNAVRTIYQDEIDSAAEFARREEVCTPENPCTPTMSLGEVGDVVRETFEDEARRRKAFSALLPGFKFFNQDDKKEIFETHYMEKHLFHRASMMKDGVVQYWVGRRNVHMCTPWLKTLQPAAVDAMFALAESVKTLELDFSETYLALCIAFFRPGSDRLVENQNLLRFLYAHYLDVFRHLVSSRSRGSREFYARYDSVIRAMPVVCRPDTSGSEPGFQFKNLESSGEP